MPQVSKQKIESASEAVMALEMLAEWFDNPNLSPPITVKVFVDAGDSLTPGFLLRRIREMLGRKIKEGG